MSLFGPRYADGQVLDIGGGLVVRLRVNGRARRVSLKVDRARGEAVAVAPSRRHLADAAAFARAKRDWLAARLAELPRAPPGEPSAPFVLEPDRPVMVCGQSWRLVPDGRRPRLIVDGHGQPTLAGCGAAGEVDPGLVARAIRRRAAEVFAAQASVHCGALGVPKPPILVTDTRSRWGSCAPARAGRAATVRLSWRLALAPFEVADYVVAHECAHLLEANHGPRFWALVHDLVGDERPHRAWLRAEGAALHALFPKH